MSGFYAEEIDHNVDYTTFTEDQTTTTNIIWIVKNFITLLDSKTIREFRTGKSDDAPDSRFQCKIQFQGKNNDVIEIYYLTTHPVFLKYNLTFCYDKWSEDYHVVQVNKWQYMKTITKANAISAINRYRSDKSMQLDFCFVVNNNVNVNCCTRNSQISNDYENLFKSGLFSDVTMKSTDQIEYKVHKAVLASRSAVLRAHFEHNTTECLTNVVESPMGSEVLGEVVTFIYTDKAPRLDEIPEKLLAAADYYQMIRLKSLCEETLHKKLTVENAIEILQLADLHSANILKQLTLEFIKDGNLKLITKTEGWAKVKSPELIKGICEYITADNLEDI